MPTSRKPDADATQRACDACRSRKVRCDKGSPCSSCKSSGSVCRTSSTQDAEPRTRVNISKEYEKKIDRIADRLVNIEELLQKQANRAPAAQLAVNGHQSRTSVSTPATSITYPSTASPNGQPASANYELNDATASTHSTVASRIIEQAVEDSPTAYQSSELTAALSSLREMVGRIDDLPSSTELIRSHSSLDERDPVEPPTESEIQTLLLKADGTLALGFIPGATVPLLQHKFDSVFKNGQQADALRCLYVHGVFWHLCASVSSFESDPVFAERCKDLCRFFAGRLEHAISELKLLIPATAEAASALTLAADVAEYLCKPLLAHSLSSRAASMVISLGYHRLSTMRSDTEFERQVKIFIFWVAYWLDTSFSVRLGRAPIIRDFEITVPRLSHGSIVPSTFVDAFNYSTSISSLQCQVVEQLYSPLALQQPVHERVSRATCLLGKLQGFWDTRGKAQCYSVDDIDADVRLLLEESDAIMHWSTVALAQHATISTANETSPALESARRALKLNINAWKTYKHLPDIIWSGHCHWALLKAPITPFTVTFCHVIAHPTTTEDDLSLLAGWVATLKDLSRFSEATIKLHRLCDIFCKVATLYVQAKSKEVNQVNVQGSNTTAVLDRDWMGQPAVSDIDQYLSTIGFAPPAVVMNDGLGATDGNSNFDASFLNDWYQGNSSLMGFLEQDLTFPREPEYGYIPS